VEGHHAAAPAGRGLGGAGCWVLLGGQPQLRTPASLAGTCLPARHAPLAGSCAGGAAPPPHGTGAMLPPRPCTRAVVAEDVGPPAAVLWRYGQHRDARVYVPPVRRVVAQRLLADGAGGAHRVVARLQLPHALRVYRVPAAQHRGGVHALKQELEADGAVLVHGALHTLVVALERHSVAGAAGVAVEVVVAPADAADAALVAVVGLLVEVVVKEAALEAGVGTKLDAACCAGSAHGLACVAQRTQHLRYRPAVQLVLLLPIRLVRVFGLVVAVPAPKLLAATGGDEAHAAAVVGAPILPLAAVPAGNTARSEHAGR
jgi:hypothetical protein